MLQCNGQNVFSLQQVSNILKTFPDARHMAFLATHDVFWKVNQNKWSKTVTRKGYNRFITLLQPVQRVTAVQGPRSDIVVQESEVTFLSFLYCISAKNCLQVRLNVR